MASVKDLKSVLLTNTFLDKPKKRKKKKDKNPKKEKSDKQKSKLKSQQNSADYADDCDAKLFAEWLKIRRQEKTKRKKNPDDMLNEEFPPTQKKNLKLSRRQRKNRKGDGASVERGVCSGSGKQDALQPISSSVQKKKNQKKRVAFNLSPVLVKPEPVQPLPAVKDGFCLQRSCAEKKQPVQAIFSAVGHSEKSAVEAVSTESQSTTDDINSQDLFITQKKFSDPYIDLCSSTSPEEAGERQGFTETHPLTQCNKEQSAKHQSPTEPSRKQLCPEHQSYIASSARKGSSPKPVSRQSSSSSSSSKKRFGPEHQYNTQTYPEPSTSTVSPKPQCCAPSRPDPQSLSKKPPCPSPPPRKPSHCHKLDVFTQTENFFTSPFLATSLRFHQRSPCAEEPVDLSLPRRSRLHQDNMVEDQDHIEPNVTDPTTSDDSDSHSKSKADMSQLKTVQTRLNESFFFKLKGEGDSPKPVSPLMKFTGSAEKKKS